MKRSFASEEYLLTIDIKRNKQRTFSKKYKIVSDLKVKFGIVFVKKKYIRYFLKRENTL